MTSTGQYQPYQCLFCNISITLSDYWLIVMIAYVDMLRNALGCRSQYIEQNSRSRTLSRRPMVSPFFFFQIIIHKLEFTLKYGKNAIYFVLFHPLTCDTNAPDSRRFLI